MVHPAKRGETIGYWKLYDDFYKYYDEKDLFDEILGLAEDIGSPFEKKGKRGRKLKVKPTQYAAHIIFSWFNLKRFRGMEQRSKLFLEKHIDHSTFARNLVKIPLLYLIILIELTALRIEQLVNKAVILFADTTAVTTGIVEERTYQGKKRRVRKDFKLHILAGYHPDKNLTYLKTALGSDKRISDAEGAKRMIDRIREMIAYFLADKGYDAEKVFESCSKKNLIPVIKRKVHKSKMASCRSLSEKFFNSNLYKEIRGVIETIFGGLENKGLLNTKLKNHESINKYSLAIALHHNIRALIKARISYFIKELCDKLEGMASEMVVKLLRDLRWFHKGL